MTFHSYKWIKTVSCVFACTTLLHARVDVQTGNEDVKLGVGCLGWVETGQMTKFFNLNKELDHAWINHTFLDLTIDAIYKERLRLSFGTEGEMWFNVPKQRGTGQATYVHQENATFKITEANASYLFGDVNSSSLSVMAGLFPYKYNPEARNLGEYLFRSGTYPAYLINNFDRAYARLTGFKVSSELLGGNLHQDLIYNVETEIPPFYDGSLSYLVDYNFKKIFDIGAGISFAHLVSVDERATTPKEDEAETKNKFVNGQDTGFYTFRGTKLMGRLCFDPKAVLNVLNISTGIFGSEDFKMYGEILALGLKSYPANDSINPLTGSRQAGYNTWGYDSLKNKMPIIFGFNVPTFKVLDVLGVEFEWYGCNYSSGYKKRLGPGKDIGYPVPDDPSGRSSVNYAKTDNWKWSVYAKRTFFDDHLGIVFQIARDHIRNVTLVNESYDYEETLSKPDQLWWMVKLQGSF
jgi:hypothetical protein